MRYLASPYSHVDPTIKEARYQAVCRAAAKLVAQGMHVLSPVAASHGLHVHGGLDMRWDFWKDYDRELIGMCDGLIVVTMDGWQESVGVKAEIEIARELGLPITYMAWDE